MISDLVLIGCGHMGSAMLVPWLEKKAARKIWVIEPNRNPLHEARGATFCASARELPTAFDPEVIVVAVKPQGLEQVLADYKKYAGRSLFLTIAAGQKLATYEKVLGAETRLVRAMPNLAAKVREAVILLVGGKNASPDDRKRAEYLFSQLGKTFWVNDEDLIDVGTVLSGCGPAYFYLLAHVMAESGAALGLEPELAQNLARQTLIGSAAFAQEATASLETLYQSVAVKGGMTEAAVTVLQENQGLQNLMKKALDAAVERGRKLSS
ncbi:MAG: pyrroline-5-carboxylate reductase [Proteobacteria bacterium]|nr:pyrroline-5-carboxylate reductase [Pseudomonadota bacterium]